jgi:TPR repeat protein
MTRAGNKNLAANRVVHLLLHQVSKGKGEALATIGSLLTYKVRKPWALAFAYACYLAAARLGDTGGQYNLACAIMEGAGTRKNVKLGLRLLRKASRSGIPEASNYLGYCYRRGIGVRKSKAKGFALSAKAARAGVADAQYAVGLCLRHGEGVVQDKAEGDRWIALAARNGDLYAQEYMKRVRGRRLRASKETVSGPRVVPRGVETRKVVSGSRSKVR